jgi:hypothetical protein
MLARLGNVICYGSYLVVALLIAAAVYDRHALVLAGALGALALLVGHGVRYVLAGK